MELEKERHKLCFVTIGATAPFGSLLSNVFQESFFTALKEHGYTDLLVQHGKEGQAIYEQFAKDHPPEDPLRSGISVKGFTFNKRGLSQEMGFAKENKEMDYEEGMILSHAGKLKPFFLRRLAPVSSTEYSVFLEPRVWNHSRGSQNWRTFGCCPQPGPSR